MSEKPQRIVADGGAGAEQDHRHALKRYRVIAWRERVGSYRLSLQKGERPVSRGKRAAREIQ